MRKDTVIEQYSPAVREVAVRRSLIGGDVRLILCLGDNGFCAATREEDSLAQMRERYIGRVAELIGVPKHDIIQRIPKLTRLSFIYVGVSPEGNAHPGFLELTNDGVCCYYDLGGRRLNDLYAQIRDSKAQIANPTNIPAVMNGIAG